MIQFTNMTITPNIRTIPIQTGSINVWVWGDANINTVTASLKNSFVYAGYDVTITARILDTVYTGDILTGSNPPDALMYYTNGGTYGGAGMVSNLRKYLNSGGGFVSYVFVPSIVAGGTPSWDKKLTPIAGSGTQQNGTNITGSLVSSSIMLQGVDLKLNKAGSSRNYFYESIASPVTQSGAVITANWQSVNQPLVVEQISGSNNARLAYINFWPAGTLGSITGSGLLAARALLWAGKKI